MVLHQVEAAHEQEASRMSPEAQCIPSVKGGSVAPKPAEDAKFSKLGFRLAMGLYLLLASWVLASGFRSVIPQLFWADFSQLPGPSTKCPSEFHSLLQALEVAPQLPPEACKKHYEQWDARFMALSEKCGKHEVYRLILRARHLSESIASQNDRELRPLIEQIRKQIGHPGPDFGDER
ncbi:MAG: hypothetical protein NZM37_07370 [Sandaracinaceae bacterium]|nr:hypothetical protein [Sandaracinaceae bacterium]MDW8246277.1 hypothetical protein [Sandaracinaceae bacterium]